MKFLCNDQTNNNDLPRGKLDAIKSQREFLSFLRHRDKICLEDVSYLIGLLTDVGCIRLATSIEEQGKIVADTRSRSEYINILKWNVNRHICGIFLPSWAVWSVFLQNYFWPEAGQRGNGEKLVWSAYSLRKHLKMFDWILGDGIYVYSSTKYSKTFYSTV